ncbi:MAG: endonuclease/exonuclease/phosphatase family protein [Alphaproteobacteria bacterium]
MDWTDSPVKTTVGRLTPVPLEQRAALRDGKFDKAGHDHWMDNLPCLQQIEIGGATARRTGFQGGATVLFWNTERLRHLGAIAASIAALAPDVCLLCEIDRGMARSQNSDRVGQIAAQLQMGYAYGVEFVELDRGDMHEQRVHAAEINEEGLHGAAVLSDAALLSPFLIRIDRRGDWFGLDRQEPRIGGTIAIACAFQVDGVKVYMVNVHLESHDDPAARAGDMRRMLRLIDEVAQGGPVVLGGDFNTSTVAYAERRAAPDLWRARIMAEPMRLLRPFEHEPLFGVAQEFGYDWSGCNVADVPTTRYPAGSARPPAKIDWFFTRGVTASNPRIIPALQQDGSPSSDHEALVVTVRPVV